MPDPVAPDLFPSAMQALRSVIDPELGLNVVDLGLVRGVRQNGNTLHLTYKLTSHACPVGGMIAQGMREALENLDGCFGATVEQLDEDWSPDDMSPEGRKTLNP